ncbi:unnamed protein product [Acanthoscelides obtectus]|nr:unnamed protein product [Acanthoscelides obtectus]CAK1620669.1 ER degradation-enhancing alpha-mannosidase-like protein 2 [Acanthoscelides obtectus]
MNALYALFDHRSQLGLLGNHIDIDSGRWTAQDAGIGSGVDSYFEYLVKGSILLQRPELMEMFYEARKSIDKYLKRDDWYMWVSMTKGQITLPVFQSLDAFWPGVLSLIGETSNAMRTLHNYHQVWQQYGFTPEFYYIPQTKAGTNKESYPLRPELIESIMYLYRATGDPYLLQAGEDILRSIQHSSKTPCGYATIKDVRDHIKEDRMESFFLSETTKYLYLLFDTDNFIHNQGNYGTIIETANGQCVIDAGGYVFNTEAHPIDPAALQCCHGAAKSNLFNFKDLEKNKALFRGDTIHQRRSQTNTSSEKAAENVTVEAEQAVVEVIPIDLNNSIAKAQDTDSANQSASVEEDDSEEDSNTTTLVSVEEITLPDFFGNILSSKGKVFSPQEMLERFRRENKFPRNTTWENNYKLLSCKAQPFLQRISIFGEFFNK